MKYDEVEKLCSEYWNDRDEFILVKKFDLNNGRYRKAFNKFMKV